MGSRRVVQLCLITGLVLFLITTMGVCSPGPLDAAGDTASLPVVDKLPCVGSLANLKSLLEQSSAYPRYFMRDSGLKTGSAAPEAVQNGIQRVSMASDSAAVGYSGTNLQTAGVDEADIVKTDGQYIYQVGQNGLNIIQAYPAQTMKIVIHVDFEQQFSPLEIYTDAARLIVIGTSYTNRFTAAPGISPDLCPPGPSFSTTMVLVYDIADKTQITKIREVELEGNYVSSRKIGHSLYLVANQYINYYYLENPATAVPCCRDSAVSTVFKPIDLASIHYFPGHVIPSYMLVAGINLTDSSRPADIQTYLGASENIYASEHNLYIAASTYSTRPIPLQRVSDYRDNSSTRIYRFALNQGSVSYTGKGDVPGTIINQFSMDESELNMRIATTSGDVWQNGQYTSRSNVYILDQNLQIKGRLEGIAPGEKIYSTRFMGNRLYMVTFRNVDPLFVIDLKDSTSPRILGQLKIPGYSNYLHPYDENHIIGFGKDTVEGKGWDGQTQAYYQGMKIALFDVTDVEHPVPMDQEIIGDRGTDSELLSNHKALLFSHDKNLLAFPVTVTKINDSARKDGITAYGTFSFQGAYIYKISLTSGLQLRAAITHLTPDDYARAGDYWYNSDRNVERILYINNTLYTISPQFIKAHDLSNLTEISSVAMPLYR